MISTSSTCFFKTAQNLSSASTKKQQQTISSVVSMTGKGLFTGTDAVVTFLPAPADHGIVFKRTDLEGAPILPARCDLVQSTPRCTILGASGVTLQTVEHVLAAVYASGIDNLMIEVSGPEVPIFDGSSQIFLNMIKQAELSSLDSFTPVYSIEQPIYFSEGESHIVALPSEDFRISYTLHYPRSQLIGSQFITLPINPGVFSQELALSRTFSLYEEIMPYIEKGLLKGGSLENAVLIKDDKVMNPEGLRFTNEMVRHKVLDMVGDLSLVGLRFNAHIIAIRSGHYANSEFAKKLHNHLKMESF